MSQGHKKATFETYRATNPGRPPKFNSFILYLSSKFPSRSQNQHRWSILRVIPALPKKHEGRNQIAQSFSRPRFSNGNYVPTLQGNWPCLCLNWRWRRETSRIYLWHKDENIDSTPSLKHAKSIHG